MNAKLDNITTQYRKFNENQALTEGQLNEFIDYFEDQDRLSRTRLSGVGVVCGFQSTYIDFVLQPDSVMEKKSGSEDREIDLNFNTIAITQGAGVTTDGDLITLRQKTDKEAEVTIDFTTNTYKYFRNYTDKVGYKHFLIGGKQIPLLELITQEEYTQLKIQGDYAHLYDQAGLMVRLDERHWIKIGAEVSDGTTLLSSVLTVGQSDWATGSFPGDPSEFWIRASVTHGVLRVQVSLDGRHWPLVRLASFPIAASYQVGPFSCTPERGGLEVVFSEFQISAPNGKALHDLS